MADEPIDIESFWSQTRPPREPNPPRDMSKYAQVMVGTGSEEVRIAAALRDNMDRIRRGREEEALLASGASGTYVPLPEVTLSNLHDQVGNLIRQRVREILQRLPRNRISDEVGARLFSSLEGRAWEHLVRPGTNIDSLSVFLQEQVNRHPTSHHGRDGAVQ